MGINPIIMNPLRRVIHSIQLVLLLRFISYRYFMKDRPFLNNKLYLQTIIKPYLNKNNLI
jgi:hypothetical protein